MPQDPVCCCRSTAAIIAGWRTEGIRFVLLLAVDDATGTAANALFRPEEDTRGYFLLMDGVIRRYGIPLALYGDRHGVFKFNGKPRHIPQPVGPTQFTRAMGELGIEQIYSRPFVHRPRDAWNA